MQTLNSAQVQRIHEVTDSLGLHRTWITVPLAAAAHPLVRLMPDAKVLICAPAGAAFDGWLGELRSRLLSLDLSRTPRASVQDQAPVRLPAEAPPGSGPKRYLPWRDRVAKKT
jgi:hypothetical protein